MSLDKTIEYLQELMDASAEACCVKAGQNLSNDPAFPNVNNLGEDVYFPCAWSYAGYKAFWLRDFVMSIPSLNCSAAYLHIMAKLFASGQRSEDWKWHNGHVPAWTPADHITLDGGHCYFPGSYFTDERQGGKWGPYPPMDNSFYFIMLVYYAWQKGGNAFALETIDGLNYFDRAVLAYDAVHKDSKYGLPYSSASKRAVDFGFTDTVHKIGNVMFGTCLAFTCAQHLVEMAKALALPDLEKRFAQEATRMQKMTPEVFGTDSGLMLAATQVCRQRDLWATAYAVYVGLLEGDCRTKACQALLNAYESGMAVDQGAVRQILVEDDISPDTTWQYTTAIYPTYQNGGYWLTPTGWYIYAISSVAPEAGKAMLDQAVAHLKATDFRHHDDQYGPYEWHTPGSDKVGHAINLTSIAGPLQGAVAVQRTAGQ